MPRKKKSDKSKYVQTHFPERSIDAKAQTFGPYTKAKTELKVEKVLSSRGKGDKKVVTVLLSDGTTRKYLESFLTER